MVNVLLFLWCVEWISGWMNCCVSVSWMVRCWLMFVLCFWLMMNCVWCDVSVGKCGIWWAMNILTIRLRGTRTGVCLWFGNWMCLRVNICLRCLSILILCFLCGSWIIMGFVSVIAIDTSSASKVSSAGSWNFWWCWSDMMCWGWRRWVWVWWGRRWVVVWVCVVVVVCKINWCWIVAFSSWVRTEV